MANTTNFNWNYGTKGQNPWWDEWEALWNAVDTELYKRSKDLFMENHSIYGVDKFVVSGHSAFGNDGAIDQDYLGWPEKTIIDCREIVMDMTDNFNGIWINVTLDPANDWNSLASAVNSIVTVKSGNSKNGTGIVAYSLVAEHNGSGTLGHAEAGNFSVDNWGPGIITEAKVLNVWLNNVNGGTIVNGYGLYVNDIYGQATYAWNIYSAGVNSRNYFEGSMEFGTYAAKGAEVFDGFITIKDKLGNVRKLMTCA
jgi:hypothetical protein